MDNADNLLYHDNPMDDAMTTGFQTMMFATHRIEALQVGSNLGGCRSDFGSVTTSDLESCLAGFID